MPRNGSGVASIVNTFTPLTTADANQVNANFTDVATMITDSLPRDGQAGMTGPLLAISGAAGEPGISWNADPDTGIRRPAGDQQALVCGGTDILTVSTTETTVTVPVAVNDAPTTGDHLTNKTYVDAQIAARGVLTGEVKMWATSTAPTGYLECDGTAVSRTTYAALFAVIGTVWGTGDGSTTFNLPDMRGEFPRGWDHGRGVDTGRAFASSQLDAFQGHWHESFGDGLNVTSGAVNVVRATAGTLISNSPVRDATTDGSNGTPRTAAETRPRNKALMFIIKT